MRELETEIITVHIKSCTNHKRKIIHLRIAEHTRCHASWSIQQVNALLTYFLWNYGTHELTWRQWCARIGSRLQMASMFLL